MQRPARARMLDEVRLTTKGIPGWSPPPGFGILVWDEWVEGVEGDGGAGTTPRRRRRPIR
jgi:hypothetical protein